MKKSKFLKSFSSIVAIIMVLSLLSPLSVSANTQQAKPFKPTAQNESTMQLKAAIAEQLNVLEGGASLHKDLQGLTGNGQVSVIVHLSKKPVALEKGMKELAGKNFTSSEAAQVKANVKTQQTFVIKEMNAKNISFKQGFTFDTVLNGFAATVKADDLKKLLTIKGVTLIEPDAIVSASEESKASTTTTSPDLVKDDKVEPAMNTSISFLGIEKLWNEGYEGQGIKVAVLDTGIDKEHPEFKGVYVSGKNFVPQVVGTDYARPRAEDDASETSPLDRPANKPEINSNGNSFYTSHGTHVAGTIAAAGNNSFRIKGIASEVDLYAYRVLGAYGSGATSGIIKAIDTAVIEKMDVINLSLGGGANSETNAGSFAINNAMMAGTISVIATGNSGPNRGTMGTPATARLGIAVGNTTNPETKHNSQVNVTVGEYVLSKQQDLMGTTFGKDPASQLQGEFDLVAVPGNGTASDYNGLDVAGKVVLVSRGAIAFVDKIAYAKANGAAGVLIHNFAGGTLAPNKSGTFLGDSFAFIPTYDLSQTDGDAIRLELAKGEGKVTFGNFDSTNTLGDDVNNSSSRGPSTPNFDIKPDVSAPGTNIMSSIAMYQADFPEASYDEAYDRKTGTSMATPHIAGIAALVKQANPTWNAFDVKVALSNTAKVLDTTKYDVFSQGAGRVDAYAAAHPEVLAYGIDTAVLDQSGTTVENLKGTVTYGPQSLAENLTVTKQIRVKDIKGNGGVYNVKVDVTKSFGDAKLTIDKPTFTLNGEQMLNVTLTASKNVATKIGDEILGYIHIESADGETEISLPFAADFGSASATEIRDFNISETDISFDGDGVQDTSVLSFTLTGDVASHFIEVWDIMNPDGGYYEDGYIGYVYSNTSLAAGSYDLTLRGPYKPWGPGTQVGTLPDGLYTFDFLGQTVSGNPPYVGDYVGPVVVKTTDPVITSETVLVTDKASFEFDGQVTDKYIDYNTELNKYGLSYDLNAKLEASFELTGPDDHVLQNGPITLNQDGSFNLDIPSTVRGNNTLTVTVTDAAGNSGSTEFVIVNEEEDVPDVVTLSVDPSNLDLKAGQTDQLEVTSTVTKPDGSKTDEDVTEIATYSGFDNSIISVDKGNVSAIAEGTTEITVKYEDVVTTVQVNVNKADVITLSVNPSSVNLKEGETEKLSVIQTFKEAGKADVLTDVTEDATYVIADDVIVSVNKGEILAKVVGTTSIIVTYGDNTATVHVTVEQTELVVDRIYGKDRIKTAIAISKDGWDTASTVILAQGYDFPDALAASPLAYKLDAPILLTKQKSLSPETIEELKRLKTKNVIIVGGEVAVSKTVDASLLAMGISVERIDGKTRFDTAAKIAKRLGGNSDKAIVTDGFNFPDALAISSYAAQNGYPILLTRANKLPSETKGILQSIPNTIVMGGNLAVSDAVFKQLKNPVRISGKDRYATAVAVVESLSLSTEKVYVATGQGFADALTGSVLAAKNGAPIILVRQNSIPGPTAQLIEDYGIRNFTLLGGEVAISKSLFQ